MKAIKSTLNLTKIKLAMIFFSGIFFFIGCNNNQQKFGEGSNLVAGDGGNSAGSSSGVLTNTSTTTSARSRTTASLTDTSKKKTATKSSSTAPAFQISFTPGQDDLTVSWTPPADAGTSSYTYQIKYGTSPGNYTSEIDATSPFVISSLDPSDTYYFVVVATSSSGATKTSPEYTAKIPTNPPSSFDVSVANIHDQSVTLSWTPSSGASSYTVKYGTSPGNYQTVVSTTATSPFTVSGLSDGTSYYFMVQAVNYIDSTSANSEVSAVPNSSSGGGASSANSLPPTAVANCTTGGPTGECCQSMCQSIGFSANCFWNAEAFEASNTATRQETPSFYVNWNSNLGNFNYCWQSMPKGGHFNDAFFGIVSNFQAAVNQEASQCAGSSAAGCQ